MLLKFTSIFDIVVLQIRRGNSDNFLIFSSAVFEENIELLS